MSVTTAPAAYGTFRDPDGAFWVAVSPVCDFLGLKFKAERNKLTVKPHFHPRIIQRKDSRGASYRMFCLPAGEFESWIRSVTALRGYMANETGRWNRVSVERLNEVRSRIKLIKKGITHAPTE
jgi:hypothetical protein